MLRRYWGIGSLTMSWFEGSVPAEERAGLLDIEESSDDGMLFELQAALDAAVDDAEAALDRVDDTLDATLYKARLDAAGRAVQEASDQLKQMKLTVRGIGAKERRVALNAALAKTERELGEMRRSYRLEHDRFQRASLIGMGTTSPRGGGGGYGGEGSYQNSDAARMEQTGSSLRNSISTVYETTEVAARTLEDLQAQRESLLSSKTKGKAILSTAGRARRTLTEMNRQQMINKGLIYGVMGLLLMVIILLIYFLIF